MLSVAGPPVLLNGEESMVADVVEDALSTAGDPEHVVALVGVITGTVGAGVTVTVKVCVSGMEHPVFKPVTVYVVVAEGLAVTTEPVVELRPVPGAHV